MNLNECGRKQSWPNLAYNLEIYLQRLGKPWKLWRQWVHRLRLKLWTSWISHEH